MKEFFLDDQKERRSIPRKSGVYKIMVLEESGKYCSIPRAIGINDNEGILYIGKSKNLYERINNFCKEVLATKKIKSLHCAAIKYKKRKKLHSHFSKKKIKIIYSISTNPDSESIWLEKYITDFGESPPLNSNINQFKKKS